MPRVRRLIIGAATAALVTGSTMVAANAFAEEGFRICGRFYGATVQSGNSRGDQYNYTGAWIGKVAKGDTKECDGVVAEAAKRDPKDLDTNRNIPWIQGDDFDSNEMTPCENLKIFFDYPDPCPGMEEGRIYPFFKQYTS